MSATSVTPSSVTPSSVTLEEVRHIAELSHLRLTALEEPAMQRDLNAILAYVAELNGLDTAQVTPMAQVSEMLGASPCAAADSRENDSPVDDSRAALREDESGASLDRDRVMAGAPETDGAFFKVPKVIER